MSVQVCVGGSFESSWFRRCLCTFCVGGSIGSLGFRLLQGKPGLILDFIIWNVISSKIYHNPDPCNFIAQTECLCNCCKDNFLQTRGSDSSAVGIGGQLY
jgi:hypothetical protein